MTFEDEITWAVLYGRNMTNDDFEAAFDRALEELDKHRCPVCGRPPRVELKDNALAEAPDREHVYPVTVQHYAHCLLVKTPPP